MNSIFPLFSLFESCHARLRSIELTCRPSAIIVRLLEFLSLDSVTIHILDMQVKQQGKF